MTIPLPSLQPDKEEEKLSPFMWATIILACAVTGYYELRHAGPIEWAAEFQLNQFGVYYKTLTFLGVNLVIWGLLYGIGWTLCKWLGVDFYKPNDKKPTSRLGQRTQAFFALPGGLQWLVMASILATGIATFAVIDVMNDGELTTVDLATLERGEMPNSNYIEIKGTPLGDQSVSWGEGDDDSRYTWYTPIVSDLWNESIGLNVFISGQPRDIQDVSPHHAVRGRLVSSGMPRYIVNAFDRSGITIAEKHVYIRCGYDPVRQEQSAFMVAILAAGFSLVAGAWFGIRAMQGKTHINDEAGTKS